MKSTKSHNYANSVINDTLVIINANTLQKTYSKFNIRTVERFNRFRMNYRNVSNKYEVTLVREATFHQPLSHHINIYWTKNLPLLCKNDGQMKSCPDNKFYFQEKN